jgi:hypothetical protein
LKLDWKHANSLVANSYVFFQQTHNTSWYDDVVLLQEMQVRRNSDHGGSK